MRNVIMVGAALVGAAVTIAVVVGLRPAGADRRRTARVWAEATDEVARSGVL